MRLASEMGSACRNSQRPDCLLQAARPYVGEAEIELQTQVIRETPRACFQLRDAGLQFISRNRRHRLLMNLLRGLDGRSRKTARSNNRSQRDAEFANPSNRTAECQ